MANIKKIKNLGLDTSVKITGDIQIYEMNTTDLTELGFLDANGWPAGDFVKVIKDINTISPTEFGSNVKYWDTLSEGGFSIYNQFMESGENDE